MTGRALIVILAFLFSACATTQSSTPQIPRVKMEGNRLVEPDYGYSLQIPAGWRMVDEKYIEKLDPNSQKVINQQFSRLIPTGLRASFWGDSERSGVMISARGFAAETREELIDAWRKNKQDSVKTMNDHFGFNHVYNLEFNRFRNITDVNASYESSDGMRLLGYFKVYSFKQSLYAVDLTFIAVKSEFDSYLPLFYDCVNSVTVSGQSLTPQERDSGKTVAQRLEELKRLKEKGLITDEEYEKKKRQILNDL